MRVSARTIHTEFPEGDDPNATLVTLVLTQAEMDAILAEYDPNYGATPSVTLCRPVVRMICAAVLAARNNT